MEKKGSGSHEEKYVLHRARPDDAQKFIEYLELVAGESDNLTFGPGEFMITEDQERKTIEEFLQSKNDLFLIAEIDGEIAANLTFRGGKRKRTEHVGEFGISVRKDFWGRGIGRKMLQFMLEWAKETGVIRKINLRVRTDNENAIHLYKSLGFCEEGLLRREFYINGTFHDLLTMAIYID